MEMNCPLCNHQSSPFYEDRRHRYFACHNCKGIYRDPLQFPDIKYEKERYLLHQNSMEDKGYIQFASPLIEAVKEQIPTEAKCLDYGCGHTPVISVLLEKAGYDFKIHDPFFFPDQQVLNEQYDLITSCEVIEHFHCPQKEFELLYDMLREGGKLICMTYLYQDGIDFGSWHYKNDPTHVFIYRKESLHFIKESLGFKDVKVHDRLIIFSK